MNGIQHSIDPTALRRAVLYNSMRARTGHIGSSLSVVEIISVLVGEVMRGAPEDPDRDRFVLSKGHAALALYAALALSGRLHTDALDSFGADFTSLGTHPEHQVPGIDFSTGSLGHGLSVAAGAALAARMEGSGRRAFVLLSDAELNEGSVWEGAMFAAQHRLSNLVAVVDSNGQQALGYTRDILDLEPLTDRWRAFGWEALEVDGHDLAALREAFGQAGTAPRPLVVIARTTFGKGVSFMTNRIEWHYLPMSQEQYGSALAELQATDV